MHTEQTTPGLATQDLPMRPRLRENVWHIYPDGDSATLVTTRDSFEVDHDDAVKFLRMRSHCTGSHTISEIAQRSGLEVVEVVDTLRSLSEAEVVLSDGAQEAPLDAAEVRTMMLTICDLWASELRNNYIGAELAQGDQPKSVLIGWLFEAYHYIADFPKAIDHATKHASGALRKVLEIYADQERDHAEFVVRTLENLGVSRHELVTSTPLVSTRAIGWLMREMFEHEPSSALMMAALVEATEVDDDAVRPFKERISELYDVPLTVLDPYFEHQEIDLAMGHADLFKNNAALVEITDRARIDTVVNNLHDLKHGFELQTLEIKQYYTDLFGRYMPRQKMRYAAL